jgi:hypothetical protein
MPLPYRMNMVDIEIRRQIRPDESDRTVNEFVQVMDDGSNDVKRTFDTDFREPSGTRSFRETIELDGQVSNNTFQELVASITGQEPRSDGHLVFRKTDLDNKNVTLKNGDRIVKMADFDTDLIIEQVRPYAPLRGDFLLLMVNYKFNIHEKSSE